MTELLTANVEILEMCPPAARLDKHDVTLAALAMSETQDVGKFLDEMEWHAKRLCVCCWLS